MGESDRVSIPKVPYIVLDPATLRALIEEFVSRDITDYGERERTLEDKVTDTANPKGPAEKAGRSIDRAVND